MVRLKIKEVLVADFVRLLGRWNFSKLVWGDNKVDYWPNYQNKIFVSFLFFYNFISKLNSKIKFAFTITTSKYHDYGSQLYYQGFRGFILCFIWKKKNHSFDTFLIALKNHISSFRFKSQKMLQFKFCFCVS
jgi:hypothetical protein